MPALTAEKFSLTTTTHGTPLVCTIKRYTRTSGNGPSPNEPSAILLLGHGTGFPKETWEPTIEDLFALDDSQATTTIDGALRVREAWALDCQNHGEAAVVNAETLVKNPDGINIYDYADAFASLYKSGLMGTLDPNLHKVILVGHSAGTVGVALATSYFNPPSMIPFSGIILVDPPIFSVSAQDQQTEIYKLVAAMTPLRRDIWASREAAAKWLRARPPCASWDQRVFDIYVKYALQPLPTPYYPDKQGVTLTTHRSGENIAFTGTKFAYHALYRLNQICDSVPIHLIFGAENDMFSREEQDSIIDAKNGRNFASVTRISGVGHLVVEEAPLKLARSIFAILRKAPQVDSEVQSRL
ncbi:Alpha/beta hydrolase fold-1 [Lyophyllum atratum]|nr:Alpha/beta hydrolase fold-1 [Lyophyllum atratum]